MTITAVPISDVAASGNSEETPLFLTPAFNSLYTHKGFKVSQLNQGGGNSLSMIVGELEGELRSPFSAPFGGLYSPATMTEAQCESFGQDLIDYAKAESLTSILVTLPADCYTQLSPAVQVKGLTSAGFTHGHTDINHSLSLSRTEFDQQLHRGARRSLNKAKSAGLFFQVADSDELRQRAYAVIKLNREQKGNPLHLSMQDIAEVSALTQVDYFLVTRGDLDIAAAIVFRISSRIAQVVYWGNDVRHNELNAIHFLAAHLWDYYADTIDILDIGPSSSRGVIDEGLANFKESLGCIRTDKVTLEYRHG